MAESAESLFRRGMISSKQAGRLAVLKGTKHQASKMAPFDAKGATDEGGIRDRGDGSGARDHINKNQRAGSPIGGKPSKGAFVKGGTQPKVGAINQPGLQQPAFPNRMAARPANGDTNKRARGTVQPSGPLYGGPSSNVDG